VKLGLTVLTRDLSYFVERAQFQRAISHAMRVCSGEVEVDLLHRLIK
jgi:hypothetical protein